MPQYFSYEPSCKSERSFPERSFAFPRGADGKCVFVWLRPRLFDCGLACFLMGNNYLSYVYFCSLYEGFIFYG